MTFREFFFDRLEALGQRQPHTFAPDALPGEHRPAAVLMAFWPAGEGVQTVFTKRPEHMPSHPGQVSFPGGRMHAGDASIEETALREAREELGIDPASVRIMGRLDDAFSIARHHVIPFVGWIEERPRLAPDADEVEEVIIADVETLLRPETHCLHEVTHNNVRYSTQAFRWDGGYVWGLTADILLELLLWVEGKPSNRGLIRFENLRRIVGA
ncbi:MAG: CoA pyrophosphatase [Gammaproteobacteria bacterium]|nr:CoA pyrophosphatase [Gammaproteobacteria bacterium]